MGCMILRNINLKYYPGTSKYYSILQIYKQITGRSIPLQRNTN